MMRNPIAHVPLNRFIWFATAIASLLVVAASASDLATAGPRSEVAPGLAAPDISDPWQPADPEAEDQVIDYILQSPLGVAALNQLAIEGFISPTCDKTVYTHAEFGSFQSLLQVNCPTPRGVDTARAYDEMRVTFNRFEDTIIGFEVERMYNDGESLPNAVTDAATQAAAQRSGADPASLTIVEFERRTWSDGCLGLGGPAEGCLAALVEGWRVALSDGDRTWVFRTNGNGTQVRLDPQR